MPILYFSCKLISVCTVSQCLKAIARKHQVVAKLESRHVRSAIICGIDGRRIRRIWQLDENMSIFFDIKQWISRYEAANTIGEAMEKIANTVN